MKRLIIVAVVLAGMLLGSIYVLQSALPLSGGAAETDSSNSSGSSDGMNLDGMAETDSSNSNGSSDGMNLDGMNFDGMNLMGAP